MWDKPQLLNSIANMLFAAAVLLFAFILISLITRLPIFSLRQVSVDGNLPHVTRTQLEEVIRQELKGNFFTVDLNRTRQAFEKLPWVRTVDVRRHWPDQLEISLIEHVPLARWSDVLLVNSYGELFNAAYDHPLPQFTGPAGTEKEMTQNYFMLRAYLQKIKQAPQYVSLSARHAWRVKLESGLVLELGREQIENRLANFVAAYDTAIGKINKKFEYVDLRYSNGFAIRVPGYKA
jgi:cell division protein FtsQ